MIDSRARELSGPVRLTDRISLGVLAEILDRDLIEEVLNEHHRREQRSRSLPAHVVVRFCQAMCLFYDDNYEEVMRKLVGSLRDMRSWSGSWRVPSSSAITQARDRLGYEPLREMFERVARPVSGLGTKGAWLRSRRLMAVDGFMLDVPDTPDNVAEFGLRLDGAQRSSYPTVRVLGLGECGAHTIVDATLSGFSTGEKTLLPDLFRSFEPDMLVMADRNFYSYKLWRDAVDTGAELLWRVSSNLKLPVLTTFPDGSYLSIVYRTLLPPHHRTALASSARKGEHVSPVQALVVRVVEYEVTDASGGGKGEVIRLITSILDHEDTSAIELAGAYHERWEYEGLIDEIKTHQRGPGRVLRSRTPNLVKQEVWSLLLTHYGVRALMCRAADEADVDPDRLSFVRSLRVIRRQITAQADFSPSETPDRAPGDN